MSRAVAPLTYRRCLPYAYPVLAVVSNRCPGYMGRLPTCYSPVRHWSKSASTFLSVRLACIRHAASVHPEPGSNSSFDLALRCSWHRLFLSRNWRVSWFPVQFSKIVTLSRAQLYYQIYLPYATIFFKKIHVSVFKIDKPLKSHGDPLNFASSNNDL